MTRSWTASLPPRFTVTRRHGAHGPRSSCASPRAPRAPRAQNAHHLHRLACWPYLYPYPQWPEGLIEEAFAELAARWKPILDDFDAHDVDACFEIHPVEDTHDGHSWEMFLEKLDGHRGRTSCSTRRISCCKRSTISPSSTTTMTASRAFHVKDAEFRPDGKSGAYGGFQPWEKRAGGSARPGTVRSISGDFHQALDLRVRRLGDARVGMFHQEPGGRCRRRRTFIADHIITVSDRAFDDFVKSGADRSANRSMLGLES
jgi:hypothetical protein